MLLRCKCLIHVVKLKNAEGNPQEEIQDGHVTVNEGSKTVQNIHTRLKNRDSGMFVNVYDFYLFYIFERKT